MSRETGWVSDDEQPEAAAMPVTSHMLSVQADRGQGITLAATLASRDVADTDPEQADPDDRMAAMVTRGYRPGQLSSLSVQLSDCESKLADERAKLERSAKLADHLHRGHESGRFSVFDILRAEGESDPAKEGDQALVGVLERQAETLREQIGAAHRASSPRRVESSDPLEQATSRAHQAYLEATRSAWAAAESGRPVVRPKSGSVSRGDGAAGEATCTDCRNLGVTDAAMEQRMHARIAEQRAMGAYLKGLEPFEVPAWEPAPQRAEMYQRAEIYR